MAQEQDLAQPKNEDLTSFSWDNDSDVFAGFGDEPTKPVEKEKALLDEIKKDDLDDVVTKTTKKKEEKPEEDVFGEFGDEKPKPVEVKETKTETTTKEEPKPEDEGEDDDEDVEFYTNLTTELKEKGILSDFALEEGEKITEEKFFELQEKEVETRVEENFNSFFQELNNDKDAVEFLKFKRNGGRTSDFFKAYAESPVLSLDDNLDLTKASNQKLVVSQYLKAVEGVPADEIEDRIEFFEEKGKLKEKAESYESKLRELDESNKQAVVTRAAEAKKNAEKAAKEFREKISATLDKAEVISKVKITKEDKKTLVDKILTPTVKQGDRYVSSFSSKMNAIMKDPEKLLLLAKLVENDFDLSDIETSIETKVVSKARTSLIESKKSKDLKGAGSTQKKSLFDHFD